VSKLMRLRASKNGNNFYNQNNAEKKKKLSYRLETGRQQCISL